MEEDSRVGQASDDLVALAVPPANEQPGHPAILLSWYPAIFPEP